jgi:hypothetical protein
MSKIEFPAKINISDLESLNRSLFARVDIDSDFVIPLDIKAMGPAIIPSIILHLFIWLRFNGSGKLIIKEDINQSKKIKDFAESFLGYSILSSSWKHKEITDVNENPIKKVLRESTQSLHKRIDFLQNLPNNKVLIPLFDHYSKPQGLSHWFYNREFEFAPSPEELSTSVYRIMEELGRIFKTKISNGLSEVIEALQIIIWELMKNTHDHAIKDYLNKTELSPNIRGIYLDIHRSSKKNFLIEHTNNSGLKNYLNDALFEGENFLLEISVFDSGPGMVKRYLGDKWNKDLRPNDEVLAIKNCLCKGITSVDGIKGENKGYGLDSVLKTLSQVQGYLKIRTGNISIYRDLLKSPYYETLDSSRIDLQDAATNSPSEFTSAGDSIGTIISMFFPLR